MSGSVLTTVFPPRLWPECTFNPPGFFFFWTLECLPKSLAAPFPPISFQVKKTEYNCAFRDVYILSWKPFLGPPEPPAISLTCPPLPSNGSLNEFPPSGSPVPFLIEAPRRRNPFFPLRQSIASPSHVEPPIMNKALTFQPVLWHYRMSFAPWSYFEPLPFLPVPIYTTAGASSLSSSGFTGSLRPIFSQL